MYEVKFGFASGCSLVFSAFSPAGQGRGLEQQPLTEIFPTGYYVTTPATVLFAGDMVLIYLLEKVLFDDAPVSVLTSDYVYYENDLVQWEGDWVIDFDTEISEPVTLLGKTVGQGEYSEIISSSGDSKIDIIINNQNSVTDTYDTTIQAQEVVTIRNL